MPNLFNGVQGLCCQVLLMIVALATVVTRTVATGLSMGKKIVVGGDACARKAVVPDHSPVNEMHTGFFDVPSAHKDAALETDGMSTGLSYP